MSDRDVTEQKELSQRKSQIVSRIRNEIIIYVKKANFYQDEKS